MPTVRPNASNLLELQAGGGRTLDSKALYDWTIYDSWRLGYSSEILLFSNPVGVQYDGAQRTLADTNMTTASLIPNGKKMVIKAVRLFYSQNNQKTFALWLNLLKYLFNTIVEFNYDGKDVQLQLKLSELLGLNFPFSDLYYEHNDQGILNVQTILRDNVKDHYPINIPIDLPSQQVFYFRIKNYVAASQGNDQDRIQMSLSGYMTSMN